MTTFAYKAIDQRGAQASGKIDGDSKVAVAATLRNQGFTVLDLNEVKQGWGQIQIGGRIKAKDLTVFSRQFATMVNSGLSMLRCLYVLEEQTPNKKFAKVISEIRADVEAGISLSDALEKHPKVFSRLYVSMVRAGELGGILDEVLNRLADQLEKEDSIRRAVKSAMVYPIMIGSFAILVLIGMVLFLIPIFAGMYKDLGNAKLPMLTRIMVGVSEIFRSWWGLVVLVAIIALDLGPAPPQAHRARHDGLGPLQAAHPHGHRRDRAQARRGALLAHAGHARSPPACPSCRPSRSPARRPATPSSRRPWSTCSRASRRGSRSPSRSRRSSVFPAMVTQMISVGEETGSLDAMLSKIADFYEDEVNASIKSLTSILEPILMLGVGAIVGVVVISMYLPIFNMMNTRQVAPERRDGERAASRGLRRDRSPATLDEIVRRNQNLLHHILKRFAYAGDPYEDLLQVANLGLIKAAQRFDADRGVRFSTYATAIVDGELRHHLRDSLLMRQPRWVKKIYREIQAKSNELMHKLGRPPEVAELAEALNINEAGILEVMSLYARIDLHSRNEPFAPAELDEAPTRAWCTRCVRSRSPCPSRTASRCTTPSTSSRPSSAA